LAREEATMADAFAAASLGKSFLNLQLLSLIPSSHMKSECPNVPDGDDRGCFNCGEPG